MSGLLAHRTYHFRLAVSTDGGATLFYAPDRTFTTLPAAPTVETGAVTSAPAGAVALSGLVDPNDAATTYYFEYGVTPLYGLSTAGVSAGAGAAPVAVSQVSGALAPATVYHYRLVASNGGGTTYGGDQTFVTAGASGTGPSQPGSVPVVSAAGVGLRDVADVEHGVALLVASCKDRRGAVCVGEVVLAARERVTKRVHGREKKVFATVTIARVAFDIPAGSRRTLRAKVSEAARRLFAGRHDAIRVTAVVTDGGRRSSTSIELRAIGG